MGAGSGHRCKVRKMMKDETKAERYWAVRWKDTESQKKVNNMGHRDKHLWNNDKKCHNLKPACGIKHIALCPNHISTASIHKSCSMKSFLSGWGSTFSSKLEWTGNYTTRLHFGCNCDTRTSVTSNHVAPLILMSVWCYLRPIAYIMVANYNHSTAKKNGLEHENHETSCHLTKQS